MPNARIYRLCNHLYQDALHSIAIVFYTPCVIPQVDKDVGANWPTLGGTVPLFICY